MSDTAEAVAPTWVAVVDGNGNLVSLATSDVVAGQDVLSAAGYTALTLPSPPDLDNNLWDPTQRAFVVRQQIDRVQEFAQNATVQAIWNNLTAAQQNSFRQALVTLLGSRRYRHQQEPVNL